jgi:hypothetical protein
LPSIAQASSQSIKSSKLKQELKRIVANVANSKSKSAVLAATPNIKPENYELQNQDTVRNLVAPEFDADPEFKVFTHQIPN